jgi:N-acetyl-anhydromuramyl-L-alanine amidase AmpD
MRKIDYIVLHCTGGSQSQTIAEIEGYWRKVLKWKNPGYHYIIEADGRIVNLLDEEKSANGVKGYNARSVHVCWIGGHGGVDNRTEAQKVSLRQMVDLLSKRYPDAVVVGHRDLSPDLDGDGKITKGEWVKMCPCFDVREMLKGEKG